MTQESFAAARAFQVVEAVAAAGTCSLADVVERTGIAFSTVHRIARFLIDRGYLVALKRGAYCLGPAALRLASSLSFHDMLRLAARPALAGLARACRAPAHLGVFDGDMVTYLVKAPYGRSDLFSVEGMQLEAYCSAIGKALLACQPAGQIEQYVLRGEFVALTPRTITDPGALRDHLAEVRTRGWALDDEEILAGLRCLAMPIRNPDGATVAAVSVSFPAHSLDPGDLSRALAEIERTVDGIAARLWAGPAASGLHRPLTP